jgi:exopolysaccharide biosynthesis polyprenyl glycosylphosphotransferase
MTQLLEALGLPIRRLPEATSPTVLHPKRQELLFRNLVIASDALALGLGFLIAYVVRNRFTGFGALLPLSLETYGWVLISTLAVWLPLAQTRGLTESRSYLSLQTALLATVRVHVIGALTVFSLLYLMKAYEVSRLFMQTFVAISALMLIAERVVIWAVLAHLGRRPAALGRRLLVIGTTPAAGRLHQLFKSRPHWGASVMGFVASNSEEPVSIDAKKVGVLGAVRDIPELLDRMVFDEVVVTDGISDRRKINDIAEECLQRGLTFHRLVPMPEAPRARCHAEAIDDGLYLVSLEPTPQSILPLFIKRVIDIAGALVGLVACGVLYVIFAPLIRLGSEGPVLFRQARVGRNGRLFTLYKFRTMYSDAEARKNELSGANTMGGLLFKIQWDPRITRVGRLLRQTYLDEFPQFWNVLKGDMSLVGTRPPTLDEAAFYSPHHRRRLSIRPGVTGLWQMQGNGVVTDFEEVVRLDCDYIDRWSIWLDLRIMMRTVVTVARLSGH